MENTCNKKIQKYLNLKVEITRYFLSRLRLFFKYLYLFIKLKPLWDSLCLQLINVKTKLLHRKYKDNYYEELNITTIL